MKRMIIIDVGSTTTKALLFTAPDDTWHYLERGEAATTVEAPFEDVQIGVGNAIRLLEERSGLSLYDSEASLLLVDEFLMTSSAGGGLQIVVCGNLQSFTGDSARRAALGSGAIILDLFTTDDGRHHFHRLERLRVLRPDMILLAGGFEGARDINFIIEMCDFIRYAKPKPKTGYRLSLPVVYAGASGARPIVEDLLGEEFIVQIVANLRPEVGVENSEPTRKAIHDLFVEHVMSSAPGYADLQKLVTRPPLPTPNAVGEILTRYARTTKQNILCIDIGGATTDVFSVHEGQYVRSVSANVGMSYSIGNVLAQAGAERILRWLPKTISLAQFWRSVGAKQLHPTGIPATEDDLLIEQAVAREALRMAFNDHQELGTLEGSRSIVDSERVLGSAKLNIAKFDIIIGSGGILSNAPTRAQAAMMLIDALQPCGVTSLFVDSVFMLPHLGVFSLLDEAAALHVLQDDCLIPLGTVLAPLGQGRQGSTVFSVQGQSLGGENLRAEVAWGEILFLPLGKDETAEIEVQAHGGLRWEGSRRITVQGGLCGLILDARGRS